MNEQRGKTSKRPFVRTAIGALIAMLGGVLAFTALTAQTPSPTPMPRERCKFWPCKSTMPIGECEELQTKVKKVFTELMNAASKKDDETSKTLREKITNSANGYEGAWSEVKARLGTLAPFGTEHVVIFYEPETPLSTNPGTPGTMAKYPDNHCLHVFYLPEVTTAPNTDFTQQFMCCYQPWKN